MWFQADYNQCSGGYDLISHIKLSTMNLQQFLAEELLIDTAVAYAVPSQWWSTCLSANSTAQTISQMHFKDLDLRPYIDTFLLDYKESIMESMTVKSNYLDFDRVLFRPAAKTSLQWKLIPPKVWEMIQKYRTNQSSSILCLSLRQTPITQEIFNNIETTQIQFVFCSASGNSQAFVGLVPADLSAAYVIRQIGYEMGFIEMYNSKVCFPEQGSDNTYTLHELQSTVIAKISEGLVMAFNFQKRQQNSIINNKQEGICLNDLSNEALAGDIEMIASDRDDIFDNHAFSTVFQTPSVHLMMDPLSHPIYRQKTQQQINQLEVQVSNSLSGELIKIPSDQQHMPICLQQVAQQMIDHLNSIIKAKDADRDEKHGNTNQ